MHSYVNSGTSLPRPRWRAVPWQHLVAVNGELPCFLLGEYGPDCQTSETTRQAFRGLVHSLNTKMMTSLTGRPRAHHIHTVREYQSSRDSYRERVGQQREQQGRTKEFVMAWCEEQSEAGKASAPSDVRKYCTVGTPYLFLLCVCCVATTRLSPVLQDVCTHLLTSSSYLPTMQYMDRTESYCPFGQEEPSVGLHHFSFCPSRPQGKPSKHPLGYFPPIQPQSLQRIYPAPPHTNTCTQTTRERAMERSLVEREEQKAFEFAGTGAVDDGEDAAALVPPPPPAVPVAPELQCRYPNKPCPQPRVPKKRDGELHSYCEYHRYKAQLYQRKLEQKKRERRRLAEQKSEQSSDQDHDDGPHTPYYDPRMMSVDQQGASWGQTVATVAPVNLTDAPDATMLHAAHRVGYRPTMNQEAFEPYPHPVTLQADDIHALQSLFIEDTDQQFKVEGGNILQARINAHVADVAMGTQAPQGYIVDLDGFAFTSEGSRQAYRYGNA